MLHSVIFHTHAVAAGRVASTVDFWTAVGTMATAVAAVVAIAVTVALARGERKRSDARQAADRADAERRLTEERERAAVQLREERDHSEQVRRRERQEACARGLLERIAWLLPNLDYIPSEGISLGRNDRELESRDVMTALRNGMHTDAAAIGHAGVAGQYRTLAQLAEAAWRRPFPVAPEAVQRARNDLRRYAVFVRLSLERFIESGQVWDPGNPPHPQFDWKEEDRPLWSPQPEPPGWRETLEADPADPWYKPPT